MWRPAAQQLILPCTAAIFNIWQATRRHKTAWNHQQYVKTSVCKALVALSPFLPAEKTNLPLPFAQLTDSEPYCMWVCVRVCVNWYVSVCVSWNSSVLGISPVYPDRLGRLNLRVSARCFLDHWSTQAKRGYRAASRFYKRRTPTLANPLLTVSPLNRAKVKCRRLPKTRVPRLSCQLPSKTSAEKQVIQPGLVCFK